MHFASSSESIMPLHSEKSRISNFGRSPCKILSTRFTDDFFRSNCTKFGKYKWWIKLVSMDWTSIRFMWLPLIATRFLYQFLSISTSFSRTCKGFSTPTDRPNLSTIDCALFLRLLGNRLSDATSYIVKDVPGMSTGWLRMNPRIAHHTCNCINHANKQITFDIHLKIEASIRTCMYVFHNLYVLDKNLTLTENILKAIAEQQNTPPPKLFLVWNLWQKSGFCLRREKRRKWEIILVMRAGVTSLWGYIVEL